MAAESAQLSEPQSKTEPKILNPGEQFRVGADKGTVLIQIAPPKSNLWDWSLYAPAIPGILVALVGLWIAHRLTAARELRKELRELCNDLKTEADDAASAAMTGWRLGPGVERTAAIHDTKRKLQAVGIMATSLAGRTKGLRWRSIDLAEHVAELRRASTIDPFEDPGRPPDEKQIGAIMVTLAELLKNLEDGFSKNYR